MKTAPFLKISTYFCLGLLAGTKQCCGDQISPNFRALTHCKCIYFLHVVFTVSLEFSSAWNLNGQRIHQPIVDLSTNEPVLSPATKEGRIGGPLTNPFVLWPIYETQFYVQFTDPNQYFSHLNITPGVQQEKNKVCLHFRNPYHGELVQIHIMQTRIQKV